MAYDAREIANYILDLADERELSLSNMKLLKIIFFAHGWYLAKYNEPLVLDTFQAWNHGPVVSTVYNEFKKFGDRIITDRAKKINLDTGKNVCISPNVEKNIQNFLKIIVNYYAKYEAIRLSEISHFVGGPWDTVWRRFEREACVGMRIQNSEIKRFFAEILAKQAIH